MSEPSFYISGDVIIHPTAAIAPGVLLQADPDSQLVIGAGVSIAIGAVLHACGGALEVEAGVCLGQEVLLVGHGCIGKNACLGSRASAWNPVVLPDQVIPSGTILDDGAFSLPDPWAEPERSPESPPANSNGLLAFPEPLQKPEPPVPPPAVPSVDELQSGAVPTPPPRKVYGLDAFNTLLTSLFPYRATLNQPLNNSAHELPPASEKSG